ncbi:MAG: tRNA lysidine(34) synthetase TilS [Pseudomonadota bacterium]
MLGTAGEIIVAKIRALAGDGPHGVAVSGGGDSMALLSIAHEAGFSISAATVDHGLRPESAAEAEMVSAFCAEKGLDHQTLTIPPLEGTGNLPARARKARYEALTEWASGRGLHSVLLGHTLDDQAETALMRLARGSGIDGLAAMEERRSHGGIAWVRPMLTVKRETLRTWLRQRGVVWVDDPTNEDLSYDRVKLRQAIPVLEQLGVTVDGLAATASRLRRQAEPLAALADALCSVSRMDGVYGELTFDRRALAGAHYDTSHRVLKSALSDVSHAPYPPRFRALAEVIEALPGEKPETFTLGGCVVTMFEESVVVCREPAATAAATIKPGVILWDQRWRVDAPEVPEDLFVASLGESGLQALAANVNATGRSLPAGWGSLSRYAQRAVPAIFSSIEANRSSLMAVPIIGVTVDPAASGISVSLVSPLNGRAEDNDL